MTAAVHYYRMTDEVIISNQYALLIIYQLITSRSNTVYKTRRHKLISFNFISPSRIKLQFTIIGIYNFHLLANTSNQDMGLYSRFVTTTLKMMPDHASYLISPGCH
jgi:hypothetical protein